MAWRGQCIVLLGKTLHFQSAIHASVHPGMHIDSSRELLGQLNRMLEGVGGGGVVVFVPCDCYFPTLSVKSQILFFAFHASPVGPRLFELSLQNSQCILQGYPGLRNVYILFSFTEIF